MAMLCGILSSVDVFDNITSRSKFVNILNLNQGGKQTSSYQLGLVGLELTNFAN